MTAKLNLNDYDRDPVQAIQEFWMNAADEGRDVGLDEIVEAVVDGQCARGDYEGCSPELEDSLADCVSAFIQDFQEASLRDGGEPEDPGVVDRLSALRERLYEHAGYGRKL